VKTLVAHLLYKRMASAAVLVAAAAVASAADAGDALSPFYGTWTMNAAKSKVEGAALPKSYTAIQTDAGPGKLHCQVELVSSDGSKSAMEFTADLNGKPKNVT
jgi:uncharacterized protein (DUF2147 family)